MNHYTGPLVEETQYYPYGLVMKGISSKAAGPLAANRQLFLGKELQSAEFTDGSGLGAYDLGARFYDPQTGRFFSPDPLAELMRRWSPYAYGFDNPVRFADGSGMMPSDTTKEEDPYLLDENGNPRVTENGNVTVIPPQKQGFWSSLVSFASEAIDYIPIVGSIKQIAVGIYNGDLGETLMGVGGLALDVFTFGEAGVILRAGKKVGKELVEQEVKETVEQVVEELVEKEVKEVAESNIVYRGLSEADVAALKKGEGLTARNPIANNSAISHIAGKKESRWISTTRNEAIAKTKYGKNGYVKIDLNKVKSDKVFLTKGINNGGRLSNWAKKDAEVLVEKAIPRQAIQSIHL